MPLNDSGPDSLVIAQLRSGYAEGRFTVRAIMESLMQRAEHAPEMHVWITRLPAETVMRYVEAVETRPIGAQPLYGIPFVIKDNIDLAGVPTTAACPQFAYTPPRSATVVQRLLDAGAIPLGKTNLDQFATGLVGVRSPYGACRNSFNGAFVAGGSSAGSAVAVASGLASFSLGTDTAGSGRVPAAFNNIVGLKPSVGRLSTRGVVPACRSLDCVSVFALTAEDAGAVLDCAEGFDAADPYSRRLGDVPVRGVRIGVPRRAQLQFFGDEEYARLFDETIARLTGAGAIAVDVDFTPFLDAARLLYEGPWIAERYAAVGAFMAAHPDALHPVTRQIIAGGVQPTAVDAFEGQYRLRDLRRACEAAWSEVDLIVTPTAGTIYRIADVEADPIRLNANLGYYTNFMNLFELAGVAVPAGFRADGLPFGVTLVGPDASERALLALAQRLHRQWVATLGATSWPLPATSWPLPATSSPLPATSWPLPAAPVGPVAPATPAAVAAGASTGLPPGHVALAVCGAHMQGLALNHQLSERGAHLVTRTRTAANYRLYALPGDPPQRPGLIRVPAGGACIEVEVWAMPTELLGSFLQGVGAPLGIGKVELQDRSWVSGFLCEGIAAATAADITAYGGWRAYTAARSA